MDPWAPINGISLERYAELSAELDGTTDPEKQAEIVGRLGVQRPDWEAAKSGWTARMQDMSLMGQVATRFMPLYQAALAKKSGGAPQVSFEDYVAMSGCVPVIGFEGMLQHYKLTQAQWTMIAGSWNSKIPTSPQYMQFGLLVEQEAARIRAGGQPKPVSIGAPAPAGAAGPTAASPGGVPGMQQPGMQAPAMMAPQMPGMAPPGAMAQPGMAGMPGMEAPGAMPGYGVTPQAPQPYAQPNPYAQQNPYAQANPYAQPNPYGYNNAASAGASLGAGLNAFGSALGSFVDGAVGAFSIGARVMVQWSDGNRYPATVTNSQGGQVEVAFPDGRRMWVPQGYVSMIY